MINNYFSEKKYNLGKLKPIIYLIDKTSKIKYNDVEFSVQDKTKIYELKGTLCTYTQSIENNSKFRFTNSVNITILEHFENPILHILDTLRKNQYFIIIEDENNNQYLVNAELNTSLSYEYNFYDTDNENNVIITFSNLCNYPLLLSENKLKSTNKLIYEDCKYNLGKVEKLYLSLFDLLKVRDNNVFVSQIYMDDGSNLKNIEFLDESFSMIETYEDNSFNIEIKFSIQLNNKQFEFPYELIEFQNNIYKAIVKTSNNNFFVVGNERGLTANYSITTSEDQSTPNIVEITLSSISEKPLIYLNEINYYRWTDLSESQCFGFEEYKIQKLEYSPNFGYEWLPVTPEELRKGDLISSSSTKCQESRWVLESYSCEDNGLTYKKWINVDNDYFCDKGTKYEKLQLYTSNNNVNYQPQEEYAIGKALSDSSDCKYQAYRWVDDVGTICREVNELYTRWSSEYHEICNGTSKYRSKIEEVSADGIDYYPSNKLSDDAELIEENSCDCGYQDLYFINSGREICGNQLGDEYDKFSSYEIWMEYDRCTNEPTGKQEYRNPQLSCQCGAVINEYIDNGDRICSSELGWFVESVSKSFIENPFNLELSDKTNLRFYSNGNHFINIVVKQKTEISIKMQMYNSINNTSFCEVQTFTDNGILIENSDATINAKKSIDYKLKLESGNYQIKFTSKFFPLTNSQNVYFNVTFNEKQVYKDSQYSCDYKEEINSCNGQPTGNYEISNPIVDENCIANVYPIKLSFTNLVTATIGSNFQLPSSEIPKQNRLFNSYCLTNNTFISGLTLNFGKAQDSVFYVKLICPELFESLFQMSTFSIIEIRDYTLTNTITSLGRLFYQNTKLEIADLSGLYYNQYAINNLQQMFAGCRKLKTLYLDNFMPPNNPKCAIVQMFNGCTSLQTIRCKQVFKNWLINNAEEISLPDKFINGDGEWIIF